MSTGGNTVPSLTNAEHIGPNDTGDNIEAKRVASYVWDGSNWQRAAQGLVSGSYDYISMSPSSARPTSVVYKSGGASGTTVATLTIAYDGSTSNITSVTRS